MEKIAVLYLARAAEGLEQFQKFAESYRKHEAGQDHDLIVIYKGILKKAEQARAKQIFKEISHQSFSIKDEGFDIHAYLDVAERINHKYVCVFNTYTELLSPQWLKKLYTHLAQPGVGIVGTTASYESLFTSQKIWNHIRWLSENKRVRLNKELADQFKFLLQNTSKQNLNLSYWRIRRILSFIRTLRGLPSKLLKIFSLIKYDDPRLTAEFDKLWSAASQDENRASYVNHFAPFPNPHIRSTGFMVSREFLLEFKGLERTKIACCKFESGWDGLTNRILRKGLSILLVGADGVAYPPEEWPKSQTFRLEQQQNLIVIDNQVSNYAHYSQPEREIHTYLSWGDYFGASPRTMINLGYKLKQKDSPG